MTTLSANQLSQNLDLSGKTILLPGETDAIVAYPDRSDFPTAGRLKRLYIARDTGVLWAWTGTTYQKTSPTTDEFAALEGDLALTDLALATEAADRRARLFDETQARQSAIAGLNARVTTNETALADTLPALIADAEGFVQHPTCADLPATGRLNRLYLDQSAGTLWRWTGTTYAPVPGEQDGGTY